MKKTTSGAFLLALGLAMAGGAGASAQHQHPKVPLNITEFCGQPGAEIVAAGQTVEWSGRIERGVVCVSGRLVIRAGTRALFDTILVLDDGMLDTGTGWRWTGGFFRRRLTTELVVRDGPIDTNIDPEQWTRGILALSGQVRLVGPTMTTWGQLAQQPRAGDTYLVFGAPMAGWEPGQRIVIPDTRHLPLRKDRAPGDGWGNPAPQREERRIVRIERDGRTVHLDSPLSFDHDHLGRHPRPIFPHVANLSRSLIIRSENPDGVRGHTLATAQARLTMEYVRLESLGRTTAMALNNTVFDDHGGVTRVGTNQIGRYPIHLHHTLWGARVVGTAIEDARKWGLAIHNAHFGTYTDNVVYEAEGAGIMTEQGNESYNVIDRNFVLATGPGRGSFRGGAEDNPPDRGYDGSCFWFSGPHNYVRDNVAANCHFYGYNFNGYYLGTPRVPGRDGDDTSVKGQYEARATGTIESRRNTVYGYTFGGLWLSWPTGTLNLERTTAWQRHEDFYIANVSGACVDSYHVTRDEFVNITCQNDPTVANQGGGRINTGLIFHHYENGCLRVKGAFVYGFDIGLSLPQATVNVDDCMNTLIEDSRIEAVIGVVDRIYRAKTTTLRNVQIVQGRTATPGLTPRLIRLSDTLDDEGNWMQPTRLLLQNVSLNGDIVSGDVWHRFQSSDHQVPKHSNVRFGVPEDGLTNVEALSKYGRSIGGRIAPSNVAPRADSDGLYGPQVEPGPFDGGSRLATRKR